MLQLYNRRQQFSYHLYKRYEEEKTYLANQLHATFGQSLVLLKLKLQYLNHEKPGNVSREKIAELLPLVDILIADVKQITTRLRPGILDDFGLFAALSWQSDEFGRESAMRTVFKIQCKEIRLPRFAETMLFRAYQELLSNVNNHAGATMITTSLETTDTQLQLTLTDNGKGFDRTKPFSKESFGMQSIEERALVIGGTCRITSSPGAGTSVTISVPLPDQNPELSVEKVIGKRRYC